MKNIKTKSKLVVAREIVRTLSRAELRQPVAGDQIIPPTSLKSGTDCGTSVSVCLC